MGDLTKNVSERHTYRVLLTESEWIFSHFGHNNIRERIIFLGNVFKCKYHSFFTPFQILLSFASQEIREKKENLFVSFPLILITSLSFFIHSLFGPHQNLSLASSSWNSKRNLSISFPSHPLPLHFKDLPTLRVFFYFLQRNSFHGLDTGGEWERFLMAHFQDGDEIKEERGKKVELSQVSRFNEWMRFGLDVYFDAVRENFKRYACPVIRLMKHIHLILSFSSLIHLSLNGPGIILFINSLRTLSILLLLHHQHHLAIEEGGGGDVNQNGKRAKVTLTLNFMFAREVLLNSSLSPF